MKAIPKLEYVGQVHCDYGLLVLGQVYDVDALGEIFIPEPNDNPAPEPDEE